MKRKEISGYLSELVDATGDIDVGVNIIGTAGEKGKLMDETLALCLVASTLMFCTELLDPDAVCPDHADALMAIITDALHAYFGA